MTKEQALEQIAKIMTKNKLTVEYVEQNIRPLLLKNYIQVYKKEMGN